MDSILVSIKKLLGIQKDYNAFDNDLIIYINAAFAILNQLGVGPKDGFLIKDSWDTWDEFAEGNVCSMSKNFVFLSVRLAFDPPSSTALLESMQRQLSELTWRLELEGQNKNST